MQNSIQTSPQYSALLGDPELAALLDAASEQRALLQVEIALANAQSELGIIPVDAGERLAKALKNFQLDDETLSEGIRSTGVPIPVLVTECRKALPADLAPWLHWGATSQDIVDSASVVQIRACLLLLQSRLGQLLDTLQQQAEDHSNTLMAGRTRTQLATPTTFGLRIAQWCQPLIEIEAELQTLMPHILRVQFGGAVGANTAVAPFGPDITRLMAQQLNLQVAQPWHSNRSPIIRLSNWLLQFSCALGKFGKDLMIQSRSEVGELRAGTAGASSTMPQKANPVQSEILVTMNTIAQAMHTGLLAAASPIEERDGASWTVEWILLPQLLLSVGCASKHAIELAQTITLNQERMTNRVTDNPELMAEAASFLLAEYLPRAQAQALVKQALLSQKPLPQALGELSDINVDWKAALEPKQVIEPCSQQQRAIFSCRKSSEGDLP